MEVQPSPSSPRSFTIPKPENGLAEWTQKIKALQRQVDADDEEEHRRLEQEIAASRLARVRRSAGFSSRLGTVDLPNVDDVNPVSEQAASSEDQFASNRQTDRADAMQKLVGSSHRPSEDSRPNASKPPSSQTKPEPISLAAFMGGRATGPRLNRHAAQQDAHDPTQFEQRDLKSISAPHPVFGRGGVAMPGLAAKGRIPPASVEHSIPTRVPSSEHASDVGSVHAGYGSDREGKRERRISTGAALRRYQEHVGQQAVPLQKTGSGGRETPRVRTFSTPTGAAPVRTTPPLQSAMKPSVSRPITPASSFPEAHASTPTVHSNGSAPFPTAPTLAKPTPPSASFIPRQTTISLISRPSSITTPSLARPIQPAPKSPAFIPQVPAAQLPSLARPIQPAPKSPSFPQVPPSKVPSPAFLRTPLQKEPTPSISKLKGRGFVQSMVKASSQLEASVTSSPTAEMGRPVPAKRLTSVAERWTPTPSPSAPTAPKTLKPRKSFSSEPGRPPASNGSPKPIEPVHTGKSLKKAPSIPALKSQHTGGTEASKAMSSTEASSLSGPGLGSSSTMISYIRPVKTGDDPATSAPPVRSRPTTPAPDVDELGVRESVVKETRFASSELPSPSGKPLSHLTKGRAKKPRKAKGATVTFKDTVEVGPRANVDTSIKRENLPPLKPASRPLPRAPPPSSTVSKETSPAGVATSVQSTDAPSSSPMPLPAARRETSKVGGIGDRWADQPIIGVKAVRKSPSPSASAQRTSETKGKENEQLRGRALPGLAAVDKTEVKKVEQSPRSPRRMSRIPSTGNRATVMDVAQVMHAQVFSVTSVSPSPSPKDERTELSALREAPTVVNGSGPVAPGKSNDNRSPKAPLPPLKEEKIPVSSPAAGARSQYAIHSIPGASAAPDTVGAELPTSKAEENNTIKINYVDDPIPKFNVEKLLELRTPLFTPDVGIKTVSVDVMSIVASTATAVTQDSSIFHESEVLAIIHRFKAKSSGLVATRVWGWHGKHSQLGEHEDRKLKDLARHYNTTLILVPQCCEPAELVHVLGGMLIVRQGSRSHWSPDNTTMHLVRSETGIIFIDEHDFDIVNLCSGFAFVFTLLGAIYVWHGHGSLPQERDAAVTYARSLAPQNSEVTELREGENDDDEMFRMMLGESGHACADYWRWRPTTEVDSTSRLWRIDATQKEDSICIPVPHLHMESNPRSHVYIIDCTWEFFVLVGQDARSDRRAIRTALAIAKEMSGAVAISRPFTPNVHAIVLPSQLPSDLRLRRRDLDERILNEQDVPDHMNIVSSRRGLEDLEKSSWEKPALKHLDMLPLGLHPSMLS